jgi:hypothetical protein
MSIGAKSVSRVRRERDDDTDAVTKRRWVVRLTDVSIMVANWPQKVGDGMLADLAAVLDTLCDRLPEVKADEDARKAVFLCGL